MKKLCVLATAVILLLTEKPAHAQYRSEIGIDAGWTSFDSDVTGSDAWRLGFRAGYAVTDWFEVEGQFAGARASQDVGSVDIDTTLLIAIANGVFSYRTGAFAPYVLAGFGGANLQASPGISSFSDFGRAWQVGGGSRFFVSRGTALRAELSFLRENTFDAWNNHWNLTGGVTWVFGER